MPSIRQIIIRIVATLAAGALMLVAGIAAFYAATYFVCRPSQTIVQQLPSPGGEVEATVVEIDGSALDPVGYRIRIGLSDGKGSSKEVAFLDGAIIGTHRGVLLQWRSNDLLEVHYTHARFIELSHAVIRMQNRAYRVVLVAGQ